MRFVQAIVLLMAMASPALAQREPVIVIPGKPGVPVYINGVDASYGVVEGEFGLDRPGMFAPVLTYRPLVAGYTASDAPGFHPTTGRRPGYGRLEIVPPPDRPKPPPAPTYYRNWSAGSASGPATDYAPYAMPNVEVTPYFGRRRPRRGGPGGPGGPSGPSHSSSSGPPGSSH